MSECTTATELQELKDSLPMYVTCRDIRRKIVGISNALVLQLSKEGKIRSKKITGNKQSTRLYLTSDVLDWLDKLND